MLTSDEEIYVSVVASALLMILMIVAVMVAVAKYQNRRLRHLKEVSEMRNLIQQEVFKAQLEMQEKTLHNISQEIHDNIGQVLSLVKLNLHVAQNADQGTVQEKLITTRELVSKAIYDLRNLSSSLNADHICHQALSALLGAELDMIRRTGLYATNIVLKGRECSLDGPRQLIVFRTAQEALHNAIKHARATRIEINLDFQEDQLQMSILDDGIGFDAPAVSGRGGTGLLNMQYRAQLIKAELIISRRLQGGTCVQMTLPLDT